MSHRLVEVPRDQWTQLRDLYAERKVGYVGLNCLNNFITWMEKSPSEQIKLLSLDNDWRNDGTFILLANYGGPTTQVFFDTLNDDLNSLTTALKCLNHKVCFNHNPCQLIFYGYVARIMPAVDDYKQNLDLEGQGTIADETIYYHVSKEIVESFTINVPTGLQLSPLRLHDAETVNEIWPHRHPGSIEFIRRLIRFNVSVGVYDESSKLIAWCLRLPIGSLGLLQVLDSHKRRGLGSLVVRYLSKVIVSQGDKVYAPVVIKNIASRNMFENLGFLKIDSMYWSNA